MDSAEKKNREAIEKLLSEGEMFLIGIGSGMEKREENAVLVDEAYRAIAAFVKGKNYFVITGNTDGKLLDGTVFHMLASAPNMEGQEESWKSYLNWLTCTLGHRLVIIELGEGFRQPQLMRWPFEQVVTYNTKAALIRVGKTFPQVPKGLEGRAFSIKEDPCRFALELGRAESAGKAAGGEQWEAAGEERLQETEDTIRLRKTEESVRPQEKGDTGVYAQK